MIEAPTRGRLRVYLGTAPGAGKTYRMLSDARRHAADGLDVVVAAVDPDAPARTLGRLEGLPRVLPLRLAHRDVVIEELDVEAVTERRPDVAVVDDLAHRNAPGGRRQHRWQDVEAIRDAGIDVMTTCDIGQVEATADAVATVIGSMPSSTVPTAIVRDAEELELVDISPRDLRARLRRGGILPEDRVRQLLDGPYREANLVALREIAFRFVSRSIDEHLERELGIGGAGGSDGPGGAGVALAARERVLVVLDDRRSTRDVVRRAATLATAMRATLAAIAIDTPDAAHRSAEALDRLRDNTTYAADLGAEIVRFAAPSLVEGLEHVARARRVTHIVLGHEPRTGVLRWTRRSVAETLAERVPGLEVHILGAPLEPAAALGGAS
jgi:two-component system, OmpR family, sensor histidine kinase KdpD